MINKCISRFRQRPANRSLLRLVLLNHKIHQVSAFKNKAKNRRKMTKKTQKPLNFCIILHNKLLKITNVCTIAEP